MYHSESIMAQEYHLFDAFTLLFRWQVGQLSCKISRDFVKRGINPEKVSRLNKKQNYLDYIVGIFEFFAAVFLIFNGRILHLIAMTALLKLEICLANSIGNFTWMLPLYSCVNSFQLWLLWCFILETKL